MSSKIKKEEQLGKHQADVFTGPIDSAITFLQNKKGEYEKLGYTNIRIDVEDEWGYYDEHWVNIVFYGTKV